VRVADARYLPFGGNRPGYSNNLPTDYRFTGQRAENFGLYDYGARFYDPLLGRFLSADSIVPGAANPQALNRFSYSYNNPLKYNDPSGHCPNPESAVDDDTSVICVDLFIQTDEILTDQWLSGYGDGRTFSPNSDPKKSRGFVYIYLKKDGTIKRVGDPQINASCVKNLGCYGPVLKYNSFTATQDPGTKEITVKWKLLNGVKASFDASADMYEQAAMSGMLEPDGITTMMGVAGLLRNPPGPPSESIDGDIKLMPYNNTFRVSGGARDPYPSLEVYHYTKFELYEIWTSPEQYGPNGGPTYGLSDQAPRDTYGR